MKLSDEQMDLTEGDKLLVSFFKVMTPSMAEQLKTRLMELLAWKDAYDKLNRKHMKSECLVVTQNRQLNQAVEVLKWYANSFNYETVIETTDPDLFQGKQINADDGKRARDFLTNIALPYVAGVTKATIPEAMNNKGICEVNGQWYVNGRLADYTDAMLALQEENQELKNKIALFEEIRRSSTIETKELPECYHGISMDERCEECQKVIRGKTPINYRQG